MRFTLIGIVLIFASLAILGVFGPKFFNLAIEAQEFDDCYEYFEDMPPVPIKCNTSLYVKNIFFALVIGITAAGIFALVMGVKGDWDQKIRSKDMLGPGKPDSI